MSNNCIRQDISSTLIKIYCPNSMRVLLAGIVSTTLVGCSLYPIPDDVLTSGYRTEDIVKHARCEMREAIVHWATTPRSFGKAPFAMDDDDLQEKTGAISKLVERQIAYKAKFAGVRLPFRPRDLTPQEAELKKYLDVAIVYTFDFNIQEDNRKGGTLGFQIPFTSSTFDLSASGNLNLMRQGQRQFTTEIKWSELIKKVENCDSHEKRPQNKIYPLDGSIGVRQVIKTFADLADQGGAKDSFVDTLIFTTEISGGIDAKFTKLNPAPKKFQLVSAEGGFGGARKDIHKMVISLVFPRTVGPRAITHERPTDGYLNAPFTRSEQWRARYNLCVADGRSREDLYKSLRENAPEVYCIKLADAFYREGSEKQSSVQVYVAGGTGRPRITQRRRQTTPARRRSSRPSLFAPTKTIRPDE